jgi:hypothetical protein
MAVGGAALKLFQTFLYALAFCCAAIVLGLYSYFLAVQSNRNVAISNWEKAVEGISGIAVVYTICAVVFTCCLGGLAFFAFLGIVLDVLFAGAFIALAVLTRDGASSCTGNVDTPLGSGPANTHGGYGSNGFGTGKGETVTYSASLGTICHMNSACFAVSLIGAFLFIIAAIVQLWLGRHHRREKRYGPSPANNYTSGSGNRWFRRRRGPKTTNAAYRKDAELGAVGAGGLATEHHVHDRPSAETGSTGTTAGTGTYTGTKYEPAQTHIPTAGGYHTGPTVTAVNPYGYDHHHTTAATNY